ncbi:MAG: glycosyltransferase family A protein [Phycisphaerales bacterium]
MGSPQDPPVLITVLIPTHDRPDRLARCVRARAGQTVDNFEIVVGVDGEDRGETDAARAVAGGRELRVLPGAHAGPAATRNRIIADARGDLLVLLNDDVEPAPDLVERHAERTPGSIGRRCILCRLVGRPPPRPAS